MTSQQENIILSVTVPPIKAAVLALIPGNKDAMDVCSPRVDFENRILRDTKFQVPGIFP